MSNIDNEAIKKCGGVKMHSMVTVGTKGQVVIPVEVREMLKINTGDSLMVITKHGKAIGMIKIDDLDEMMEFMKREIEEWKNIQNKI